MISKLLHNKIEECSTMEELEGVLWEVHEFGQERSWLYSHGSHKATKLQPVGGLGIVSKILKPSYHTLSTMGGIWDKFRGRRTEFPRLSYSFFETLAHFKIPKEDVALLLKEAEDKSWVVAKFKEELGGRYGGKKPLIRHDCPECGVSHPKGEPNV